MAGIRCGGRLSGQTGPAPGGRRWHLPLVLLPLLLAGGCAVQLVYNQLDWLAVWYVGRHIDLSPAQKNAVREIVDRQFTWHRSQELPDYVSQLRVVAAALDQPLDAAQVEAYYQQSEILWARIRRQLVPDAAGFLPTLDDVQVERFFSRLAEGNSDLAREYSGKSAEKRRQRQAKVIEQSVRRVAGSLDPAQRELIRERAALFHDTADEWIARRIAWQAAFRQLMGSRHEAGFATGLARLFNDPDQFDSAEYRRDIAGNRRVIFNLLAELSATFSDGQRRHAREYIERLADDLEALSRRSPA